MLQSLLFVSMACQDLTQFLCQGLTACPQVSSGGRSILACTKSCRGDETDPTFLHIFSGFQPFIYYYTHFQGKKTNIYKVPETQN